MPWATREKARAYAHRYNATEHEKEKRAMRNAARREAVEKYGASAVAGKDVDHRVPLDQGGSNQEGNLRLRSIHSNRGFARDAHNQPKIPKR